MTDCIGLIDCTDFADCTDMADCADLAGSQRLYRFLFPRAPHVKTCGVFVNITLHFVKFSPICVF